MLCVWPATAFDQVVIEGRVELPRAQSPPVANKRYEIVSKGGVLAPSPPVAVVYLEGSFARPGTPAVTQMIQKDLVFVPALLPVQAGTQVEFPNLDDTYHNIFSYSPANGLTWAGIVRMRGRYHRKSSTSPGW